jgi:hypothetical protein
MSVARWPKPPASTTLTCATCRADEALGPAYYAGLRCQQTLVCCCGFSHGSAPGYLACHCVKHWQLGLVGSSSYRRSLEAVLPACLVGCWPVCLASDRLKTTLGGSLSLSPLGRQRMRQANSTCGPLRFVVLPSATVRTRRHRFHCPRLWVRRRSHLPDPQTRCWGPASMPGGTACTMHVYCRRTGLR